MSGKRANSGNRALMGVVGFLAAFGARKVLHFVWKQVTGKEPPDHPEDPQVALSEALAWGLVLGAGVAISRMLATRFATKRVGGSAEPAE